MWCLFAEDLGQIPEHRFTRIVDELIANPSRSSADDLGQLFTWLNTSGARPEHGQGPALNPPGNRCARADDLPQGTRACIVGVGDNQWIG